MRPECDVTDALRYGSPSRGVNAETQDLKIRVQKGPVEVSVVSVFLADLSGTFGHSTAIQKSKVAER